MTVPMYSTDASIEATAKAVDALLYAIEAAPSSDAVTAYRAAITRHGRNLIDVAGPEALGAVRERVVGPRAASRPGPQGDHRHGLGFSPAGALCMTQRELEAYRAGLRHAADMALISALTLELRAVGERLRQRAAIEALRELADGLKAEAAPSARESPDADAQRA
ncbi:hypothetical protein ABS772_26185 [Methylorubrum podarium]|uniref:DUF2383 domain-containing protein n=1 Tax=Methylorubrum podarium TaxID=200476 RepID=A0ABV1QVK3_9HYPH